LYLIRVFLTPTLLCHFGSKPPIWHAEPHPALTGALAPESQAIDSSNHFLNSTGGTPLDTHHGMKAARDPLVRHLAIAVALKLAVLCALWWAFIRDERVGVDIDRAAAHLVVSGAPETAPARTTSPSGAQP
jgi:hypothetical protein